MIEYIRDKWLTWHTGDNKQICAWRKWQDETIVWRANTIENMFVNFKYILPVTTDIFDFGEPFDRALCEDFAQYCYPNRAMDNCAVYYCARGFTDKWSGQFHFSELVSEYQVFVATNNETDAVMIALKYA